MTYSVPHRPDSGYATRPVPDLHLNFLPLLLSQRVFMGGMLPFDSPDQLRLLRNQYNSTHVLRRQGDQIACVPLVADAPSLGAATTFEVAASWSLVRRLVQDALIRSLVAWGLRLTRFDPPAFVARQRGRDLLAEAAADLAGAVTWLHVYPQYALDARVLHVRGGPSFGILVGFRSRREIDLTVADLVLQGMDVRGRYVLAELDSSVRDDRLNPRVRRRLAGRIDAVNEGDLLLSDAPRHENIPADRAWLEARLENFPDRGVPLRMMIWPGASTGTTRLLLQSDGACPLVSNKG